MVDGRGPRVGTACRTNDDCAGGLCLPARDPATGRPSGFPGGYCIEVGCAQGKAACPAGSLCVGDGEGVCLAACDEAACRAGYACAPVDGGHVCVPACTADADCDSGICDAARGLCRPNVSRVAVGARCSADADCGADGFCLTEEHGYPQGYCVAGPCEAAPSRPETACPQGAVCVGEGDGAVCLATCSGEAGCREGYLCLAGRCLPRCRDDSACGEAQVCDLPSGRCVDDLRQIGEVGGTCEEAEDCGPGGVCLGETDDGSYVGGYCTGLGCRSEGQGRTCPEGSLCVGEGDMALCLGTCAPLSTDCRPGYVCADLGDAGGCIPACARDADCDPAGTALLRCDVEVGLCMPRFDDVPVGESCRGDATCGAHGTCLVDDATDEFPDGYCSAIGCSAASPCPPGSVCFRGETSFCLQACSGEAPCRAGYICSEGACVPGCRVNADCGATMFCNVLTGFCAPDFSDVEIGKKCSRPEDCGTHGTCFDSQDFPAGYCSALGCSEFNPCPSNSTCHDLDGQKVCLLDCATPGEVCRGQGSYKCAVLPAGPACVAK